MKRLIYIILPLIVAGCHQMPDDFNNDAIGNFDSLWKTIDTHYCFFQEKDVDWNEIYTKYRPKVNNAMSSYQLYEVCSNMLAELRDGHTNLSSPFATSYYRQWWSDYPQNYDARIIQQYYFNFNYRSLGAFDYGILPENIAYIHYSTFESGLGAGNIDYILAGFSNAQALIIDVRDNGGGSLTNVESLVNRFIDSEILAGYIVHKTGPGHNDFSDPYPYYISPVADGHYAWGKPVVVLTNRSTFSAANNFVSIMSSLPNVTIIGNTTGGGSGMPISYELPNGWGVRFSGSSILDANGNITEFGVNPTEGCTVNMTDEDIASGHDTILDFAIDYIKSYY